MAKTVLEKERAKEINKSSFVAKSLKSDNPSHFRPISETEKSRVVRMLCIDAPSQISLFNKDLTSNFNPMVKSSKVTPIFATPSIKGVLAYPSA